jgi:hypothetical protein
LSPVRSPAWERAPLQSSRTDLDPRSSVNPRRLPAPREPGCLPPLRPRARERIAPPVSRVGLPLTPPTRCPMARDNVPFRALQSVLHVEDGTSPPGTYSAWSLLTLRLRENRSPLQPRRGRELRLTLASPRLGLTTQARQRGSVCEAVARAGCSRCTYADRSASTAGVSTSDSSI